MLPIYISLKNLPAKHELDEPLPPGSLPAYTFNRVNESLLLLGTFMPDLSRTYIKVAKLLTIIDGCLALILSLQ